MSLHQFLEHFKRGEFSIVDARIELISGFHISGKRVNELLLQAMRIPA